MVAGGLKKKHKVVPLVPLKGRWRRDTANPPHHTKKNTTKKTPKKKKKTPKTPPPEKTKKNNIKWGGKEVRGPRLRWFITGGGKVHEMG